MNRALPLLIQGGMGVGVSNWQLAHAVSSAGQLGVVSGTAVDTVFVRRLQMGDLGGHVRRALEAFPFPAIAEQILEKYFIEGGKQTNVRFKPKPMPNIRESGWFRHLVVAANFVEVFLAKEGHRNGVGINLLEKVQAPNLASLYGAMLAGVDWVLMGAGIPKAIPGVLDRFADGLRAELRLDVKSSDRSKQWMAAFDPKEYADGDPPEVLRPKFLPIISSHVLATALSRDSTGVDGFVVEAPTAGGHNAPPRGKLQLSDDGEPIYGERDIPDFEAINHLGLPFWLAGSRAEPEAIVEALDMGAAGVQVGTAFAFCDESGFSPEVKSRVIELSKAGEVEIFTDPIASPTGFPFKVAQIEGTLAEDTAYQRRERVCDLGYLRTAYDDGDGKLRWRCPAEPVEDYLAKGGKLEETVGRKCLCNALTSAIGLGQIQVSGDEEQILVTSGDDISRVARFVPEGEDRYTAKDVIEYLLRDVPSAQRPARGN